MKKILNILSAIFVGFAAFAQSFTGTWEVFPNFSTPSVLVETPEYVYTLAGTSLIGYDKATEELAPYNTAHRLNGNAVSGIWYDPEAKYLFVAYTDYNIDLVFDDGRTINVPDLRDAAINTSKDICNVAFADGKAYIGSGSGLIVVDAQYGAVVESCLWGMKVDQIAVTPKKLLIYKQSGDNQGWYVADRNVSHHNFAKAFSHSDKGVGFANNGILSAHGKIAYITGTYGVFLDFNDEAEDNAKVVTGTTEIATGIEAKNIQVTKDGFIFSGSGKAHRVNATTGEVTTVDAPKDNKVASWDGKTIWLANNDGITQSGSEAPRLKPNSTSGSNVGIFRQSPDGTIYMSTVGVLQGEPMYSKAFGQAAYVDKYVDGNIIPVVSGTVKSLESFDIVPSNSNEIIVTTASNGAILYDQNGEIKTSYTSNNTTFNHNKWVHDVKFDKDGSIWFLKDTGPSMHIYKAIAGSWEESIDKTKWSEIAVPDLVWVHSARMLIDEQKQNIVATGKNGLAVVKMPTASDNLTSASNVAYCSMTVDEDGNTLGGFKFPSLAIDKSGWLWIASDAGVRVIRNTEEMFNPGFAPFRPKVPRNDGTNLADYLLDQVEIVNIAVDENNEKWISTNGSGLYHVNADGSEIIEHFTASNSEIPSDIVFACLPDKYSNKIFVGTEQGLAIYHSTSAPAKSDLKDVYAYPNPVTPEYTGHINVAGLMDGTLVKIADAAGNVFYQGKSSGGMITWNGCDSSGSRVKSGVYFVFASKSGEDSGSYACVTKIVVVN